MQVAQTNISTWGNSKAIRIPKSMLDIIGLSDNDKVDVTVEPDSKLIAIKAAMPKYNNLDDLFQNYTESYQPELVNLGDDVYREI